MVSSCSRVSTSNQWLKNCCEIPLTRCVYRYQAREALLDPKNWLLVLMTLCTHMVNGGVSGFGTIIVRSFGYSPLKSVLMVGCVGVVVLGSLLISG